MISSQTTRISSKKQYVDTLLIAPDFKVAALTPHHWSRFSIISISHSPRRNRRGNSTPPRHRSLPKPACQRRPRPPGALACVLLVEKQTPDSSREPRAVLAHSPPTSNFFEIRRQRHAASRRRSCQAQPKLNRCRTRPGIGQTPDDCLAPRHITPPSHPPCGLPE